jgi:hypothetical protein
VSEAPPDDTGPERPASSFVLDAEFSWPARGRKTALHGLTSDEASLVREALRRQVVIDLSAYDRMRLSFESDAFPVPRGSALLARHDKKGHLLVWPDDGSYRVVPDGAVRAFFREHRLDVTPALSPLVEPGKNGHRFDAETEIVELTTAHGRVRLEQLPVQDLGFGGALLCRLLLEFVAASPPSEVCRDDTIPVHAELHFEPAGDLLFSVQTLGSRTDSLVATAPRSTVAVPPRRARFVPQGLPPLEPSVLEPNHLRALRAGAADAPTGSLRAKNPSWLTTYVLLDDTPVAVLPPRARHTLSGLREGQYQLSSLTFLGEVLQEPTAVTVPGPARVAKPSARLDAGTE